MGTVRYRFYSDYAAAGRSRNRVYIHGKDKKCVPSIKCPLLFSDYG